MTRKIITCSFFIWMMGACSIYATELIIPSMKITSGSEIVIPVLIDDIENMAGIKLSLEYDKQLLTYQKGEKTPITSSLMHIINDKKPGKLIIVMAGARGVKVKNEPIIKLFFKANTVTSETKTNFTVNEIQLMSDQLKEINSMIRSESMTIQPMKTKTDVQNNSPGNLNKQKDQKLNQNITEKIKDEILNIAKPQPSKEAVAQSITPVTESPISKSITPTK